jgi:RNA polymerase sigma-54 factor
MLNEASVNEKASEYITKKLSSAMRLIKSIEQRRNTIYRVVEAILEYQYDFFEKGPIYLKTLTLKTIADQIGVHESTVSRATSGKYMQCPTGLFELKYFFQSGVATNRGDGVSSESIKIIIKEMIEKEPKSKPLSDQNISLEFDKIGVKISRRTVAKYRTELGIASTSKRKIF